MGHSRLRKSWKGTRQNLLSTASRSVKTTFGPVHLSSAPTETTPGLNSGALGSARSTFPYGLRPFARNVVMYSVAKGSCAAQAKRRHLGEPCELRLNRKFLPCCRERFPTTAYPPYSHELFHIVSAISSVCGRNMPLIQLRGEPCQLEKPELENIRAVPAPTVSF